MTTASTPEPVVAVRGQWRGEVQPEVARVFVSAGARGDDRSKILTLVSGRVDEVRKVIDAYGEGVERVDQSALQVMARFRGGKPTERRSGYVAEVRLSVLVTDFAVLGDMLLRLAEEDMVTVDGPHWSLRPDSDVYRNARTEAVRDARARAEEYAAAAGSRLTGLVEIADVGLSGGYAGGYFEDQAESASLNFMSSGHESVADRLTFDVQPVPQTVSASVHARFTLTQPDFS